MQSSDFTPVRTKASFRDGLKYAPPDLLDKATHLASLALLRDGAIPSTIVFTNTVSAIEAQAAQIPGWPKVSPVLDAAIALLHDISITNPDILLPATALKEGPFHERFSRIVLMAEEAREALRDVGEQLWNARSDA